MRSDSGCSSIGHKNLMDQMLIFVCDRHDVTSFHKSHWSNLSTEYAGIVSMPVLSVGSIIKAGE